LVTPSSLFVGLLELTKFTDAITIPIDNDNAFQADAIPHIQQRKAGLMRLPIRKPESLIRRRWSINLEPYIIKKRGSDQPTRDILAVCVPPSSSITLICHVPGLRCFVPRLNTYRPLDESYIK
jgi:hypothetical protein